MSVTLCEVGPRDGLQNEQDVLAPQTRAELVNRLAATGLPRIEAVSFVRDDAVPQMAGAEEVVEGIERRDGVEYVGLVLNEKGFERFAASGLDRVNLTLGATESFNQRNANATLDEAVERVTSILAQASGPSTVTISVAFGCPFEGRVDPAAVAALAERFSAADEIVLADTIGVATPRQVKGLIERTRRRGLPRPQHTQHRVRERVRSARGWRVSARRVDRRPRRVPFAPRATGNIATEDLVYMLEGDGVDTGVDVDALIGISDWLEGVLGRQLEGQLYRAGSFPSA